MNYKAEAEKLKERLKETHDWCASSGMWVDLPVSVRMVIIAGLEKTEERLDYFTKCAEKEEVD